MIQKVSQIKWAGSHFESIAILDEQRKIIFAPTMYLVRLSLLDSAPSTVLNYAYRLDTFFKVLLHSKLDWHEVNEEHMSEYTHQYLQRTIKLKETSFDGHVAAIDGFYKWAWNYGYLDSPKVFNFTFFNSSNKGSSNTGFNDASKTYIDQYISKKKFRKLLENITTNDRYLLSRNELILYIAYYMGLRRSEIVSEANFKLSELNDLDFKNKKNIFLLILGKGGKLRRVPVNPTLHSKINAFLKRDDFPKNAMNLICDKSGKNIGSQMPYVIFKQAAIKTKDPYWDTRVFHSLRHTYATNMVTWLHKQKNKNYRTILPEYMGHKSVETTDGYIQFEAIKNNRHSILNKLKVKKSNYRKA